MSNTSWERALCLLPPSSAGSRQRTLPTTMLPMRGRARPGSPPARPQSRALKTAPQITEPGQLGEWTRSSPCCPVSLTWLLSAGNVTGGISVTKELNFTFSRYVWLVATV